MTSNSLIRISFQCARGIGGFIGFLFLIGVEFIKRIFSVAFSLEQSISEDSEGLAVNLGADSAAHRLNAAEIIDQASGSSAEETAIALGHVQMHSGVIRDATTRVIKLSLYGGKNPRIERTLRLPAEKLDFQRINWRFDRFALTPFTPELAQKECLTFNFEGAKRYSLADLEDSAVAKHSVPKVKTFNELPSIFVRTNQATLDNSGQTSTLGADALVSASQAEGIVTSANNVLVTPDGKPPYKSFAVVVKTTIGESSFQGTDLEDQFKKYKFSLHDRISIQKSASKFDFTKPNGKTEQRTKNIFVIKVLEKA